MQENNYLTLTDDKRFVTFLNEFKNFFKNNYINIYSPKKTVATQKHSSRPYKHKYKQSESKYKIYHFVLEYKHNIIIIYNHLYSPN